MFGHCTIYLVKNDAFLAYIVTDILSSSARISFHYIHFILPEKDSNDMIVLFGHMDNTANYTKQKIFAAKRKRYKLTCLLFWQVVLLGNAFLKKHFTLLYQPIYANLKQSIYTGILFAYMQMMRPQLTIYLFLLSVPLCLADYGYLCRAGQTEANNTCFSLGCRMIL